MTENLKVSLQEARALLCGGGKENICVLLFNHNRLEVKKCGFKQCGVRRDLSTMCAGAGLLMHKRSQYRNEIKSAGPQHHYVTRIDKIQKPKKKKKKCKGGRR